MTDKPLKGKAYGSEILDTLCNIDLWQYVRGYKEGDDVGRCRGIICNYCGRYNEELHQTKQEEP